MAKNVIYFAFVVPPGTGGDSVSLDHIVALNAMGFDTRAFYCAADDGYKHFSVPIVRAGVRPEPGDIVTVGEVHKYLFDEMKDLPCIKVLHNQNPYYTFYGFDSVADLNAYPLSQIIVPSDFCAAKLLELGVTHPMRRVRPALPPSFAPGHKSLRILFSPQKREIESGFMKEYFRALVPEYAHVPWTPLIKMTRNQVAGMMRNAAIFASFPQLEGLGLLALEAMASGCHVVGYTGHGGSEYATPENGDWIAEGDHRAFAERLRDACRLFESGADNPRIAAGHATAAKFSREGFEAELKTAWTAIMGANIDSYRR